MFPCRHVEELSIRYVNRNSASNFEPHVVGIRPFDCQCLAKVLAKAHTLRELRLASNRLDDDGVCVLASGLGENSMLQVLDLSHNQVKLSRNPCKPL